MDVKLLIFNILFIGFFLTQSGEGANILGIFPTIGKSHSIQGHGLLQGLAKRGHNVTILTNFPTNKPLKNYRELVPEQDLLYEYYGTKEPINVFEAFKNFGPSTVYNFFVNSTRIVDVTLRDPVVQKLLHSKEEKFDVVICVSFLNEAIYAIAHHFKVPLIVYSLSSATIFNDNLVGNPAPYAYVPVFSYSSQMTFFQRVGNTLASLALDSLRHIVYFPMQDAVRAKHFPDSPDIFEIMHSTSLMLVNSHNSISSPRPIVPNMIEIGGFQTANSKPLPADLKTLLDNSKQGVIFVSLGSNVLSKHMPEYMKNAFVSALGKRKEQVLWKWEDDVLPGKPNNIKTSKWFPQSDLLDHPNVKLFITHGGWGSISEAIHSKVPLVGIPVGADQFKLVKEMAYYGYGVAMDLANVTSESLSWSIQEAIENPKYKEKIVEISALFHDREIHPMDRANYWIEYVIRTKGAKHLRSPALQFNRFQLLLLDVVGFLALVIGSICFLIYFVTRKVINLCRRYFKKTSKKNAQKKKN